MKKYLIAIVLISWSQFAQAQDFITRWNLGFINAMQPATSILYFDIVATGPVAYTWQTVPVGLSGSGVMIGPSVTLSGLPTGATIKIMMDTTNLRGVHITNSNARLLDVEQWGGVHWSTMEHAFEICSNLNISAIDIPDLSAVNSTSLMFYNCSNLVSIPNINSWNTSSITDMSFMFAGTMPIIPFNEPIGNWNTANVTNMADMFANAIAFNQPIGNWNTSNVTNMSGMFASANSFNQPIGNWNTSNVTNMSGMFFYANSFNQAIGNWNTSNVTNMSSMFSTANSFNQAIGNWNTANVTNMSYMFSNNHIFNQPIGSWNTGNVSNMSYMFRGAFAFNQPIGSWNTSNVTDMSYMFKSVQVFNQPIGNWNTVNVTTMNCMFLLAYSFNQPLGNWQLGQNLDLNFMLHNCGLDCTNYSATLTGWNNNPNTPPNRTLGALNMKYFISAQNDRNYLINNKGWTISGDYLANNNCCIETADTFNFTTCNSYFFNGQTLTNSGTYNDTLMNVNGCDSLVTLNLTIYQPTSETINQTACNSYLFDGQMLTNSGTYFDTLMNVGGCDSMITLNLIINLLDTSVSQSGANLTANTLGATYQWLTCNPYQVIIGEVNQTYSATANGEYAVIVSQNGCTDTSACYNVVGIGTNTFELSNNIKIYPNPVFHTLQVEAENEIQLTSVKLIDLTGKVLLEPASSSLKKISIDMSSYSSGNYFIQITNPDFSYVKKIYKE